MNANESIVGNLYVWKTRISGDETVMECREAGGRKGGLRWGIPGNPYSSSTTSMQTLGWVFVGTKEGFGTKEGY
jgi:hypothetical protein